MDTHSLRQQLLTRPVLIVLVLMVGSQLLAFVMQKKAEETAVRMLEPLESVERQQTKLEFHGTLTLDNITEFNKINIILRNHKLHCKEVFVDLYKHHFPSTLLVIVFSVITGIFVFLIGQKGWKEVPNTVKAGFLTSAALTSFYVLSIQVFNQDEIINKNLSHYIVLDNMQKEIFNFCGTYPSVNSDGDTLFYNEFHNSIMDKLISTNEIYVEFNEEHIDVGNYSEMLKTPN